MLSSNTTPRTKGLQVLKKAQQNKAQVAKAAAALTEDDVMGDKGDEDADMEEEDMSYSKVASKGAPKLVLSLFLFKVFPFIMYKVFTSSKMSTGDNIRNRTCQVMDLIIENLTDCYWELNSISFFPSTAWTTPR